MYKLKDFAQDISVAIKDVQSSPFDRFVGLEHYDSGEPVITRYTDKSLLSSSVKEFQKNDILIARRNVYLKRAGIAFFDGLTSGDSIVLRVYDDCESRTGISKQDAIRIIPFILNSNAFWAYANKHADGMNSKRISKEMLYDYEFDLPPIAEQKVLADKLWAAYRLKESYKKLLTATEEMVKSQFIEMTGDPRTNPKGWPVKTLSELATYSIGLTYKPENISEEGTIVLRSGNIQNSKIDLADVVRVNCPIKESIYVQKNDILMCSRNGSAALVGKVAQIKDISEPMTYGAFMTVIRSEYSDFLYLYFQSNDFREQVSTGKSSTMNQITQNMLDKISLPLPDDETRNKLSIILHQADKSGFDGRKSQFIEMFGNPVTNNKEWNTLPIKDVAPETPSIEKQTGKVWILNLDMIESNTGKVVEKVFENDSNLLSVAPFDEGNVLYSKLRPYLNKVVIPDGKGYATTELVPLRPNQKLLNLTFFSHLLRGDDFVTYANSISTGTKMPRMPLNDLRKFQCILPPMEKQNEFEEIARQADKSGFRTQQIH